MHTDSDRFWSKVDKTDTCWVWTASVNGWGYGRFVTGGRANRREHMAHRWAYEQLVGPVPSDRPTLDHLCRVRRCVNPAHMEPTTPIANLMRGMGAPPRNARKTHCPKGHPFTESNTIVDKRGWRRCRLCALAWKRTPEQRAHRRATRPSTRMSPESAVEAAQRLDKLGHPVGRRALRHQH